MTHICVSKLTIIGSDNGLSPDRRQAIIWTNDGILLIGPLGTNFSEILMVIHAFPFKKMHLKMSSGKWRPFCLGLSVLISVLYDCSQPELSGVKVFLLGSQDQGWSCDSCSRTFRIRVSWCCSLFNLLEKWSMPDQISSLSPPFSCYQNAESASKRWIDIAYISLALSLYFRMICVIHHKSFIVEYQVFTFFQMTWGASHRF